MESEKDQFAQRRPRLWVRLLVSILLLFQLAAVVVPPLHFASQGAEGPARSADVLLRLLRPWVDFAYLNHGYFFFAPNPGASHLLEYEVELPESGETISRRIPDLDRHWPRLLYHRHFMLAEWLTAGYVPPSLPPEIREDPQIVSDWQQQRRMYEAVWQSYRRHLQAAYATDHVSLRRIQHRPPSHEEFHERGMRLDDERLYRVLPETLPPEAEFPPGAFPPAAELPPGGFSPGGIPPAAEFPPSALPQGTLP